MMQNSHLNPAGDTVQLLEPGRTILNRYDVVRELNRGGTAVVYLARDLQNNGLEVALKAIRKDSAGGSIVVPIEKLKKEVELVARLRPHPNIVQLLDVVADGSNVLLVFELVRGPDLLDFLNEQHGRLREEVLAPLLAQALGAVDYLHAEGLAHRDLKPENLVLDRASGRVMLIDFGLAKNCETAQTLGVGTPDYLSPELVVQSSTGVYNAKAVDSWAAGVLIYLLVTGRYPFEDPSAPGSVSHTLRRIQSGLMRPLPLTVSAECSSLILSLLQADPAKRLSISEARRHPFMHKHGVGIF